MSLHGEIMTEALAVLRAKLAKAKKDVERFTVAVEGLAVLVEEPETPPDNSHEGEPSGPIKHSASGFVGVYPVGANSKKWYASVTEKGKTKRLPCTYDTPEQASKARSEYLQTRDDDPERPEGKRTFGPSDERPV